MKRAVSRKVDERARRDEPVAPKRAGSRNVDERARRGESAAPSGAPSHKVDERARRDEIVPPKHAGSRKVGERVRRDELASPKRAGPGKVDALLCAIGRASTVPTVRSAVRSCLREWKRDEPREIALAALELARRGKLWFACEVLEASPAARSTLSRREVELLARGLDSWGSVDAFACFVVGPLWRERVVSDAFIARWASSTDRWLRRAALVSTVALNTASRGGEGDARRTLTVCERLVRDRDDMVVKALSWALRVLSKPDPRAVRSFLAEHRSDLASRVLREVETKLATGVKRVKQRA